MSHTAGVASKEQAQDPPGGPLGRQRALPQPGGKDVWALRQLLPTRVVDGGIALGVTLLGVVSALGARHQHERVPAAAIAVLAAMGLILFPRRRFPGAVLIAMAAFTGALVALRTSMEGDFVAVLVASYSAAVYGSRRLAIGLAATAAAVIAAAGLAELAGVGGWLRSRTPLTVVIAAAGAWIVGLVIRGQFSVRAAQLDVFRQRAELSAERQREEARRATLAERLRIARELHDIVAHHISVVVIQAQGAQRMLDRDPGRSRAAMAETERTGRTALEEMRRLLGLLRSGEADGGTQGQELDAAALPGLADLGALAESMRGAGLDVTIETTGQSCAVPENVGLTVYRIVQEALTNALKHAGPAQVMIQVDFTGGLREGSLGKKDLQPGSLRVTVTDSGRGAAAHLDGSLIPGSGRGIAGMSERVAAVGGQLTAGPRPGGGFRVHASIPLAQT
jgi:signal transduction histidine kinase